MANIFNAQFNYTVSCSKNRTSDLKFNIFVSTSSLACVGDRSLKSDNDEKEYAENYPFCLRDLVSSSIRLTGVASTGFNNYKF